MLTKGVIEKIISPYKAKVRLPVYDSLKDVNYSTSTENLSEATVCSLPNCDFALNVGDVVFVSVEDNDFHKPVIVGFLYSQNKALTQVDAKLNSLEVITDTKLSSETTIGKVSAESIQSLYGVKENIQAQIDELKGKSGSDNQKDIDVLKEDVSELQNDVSSLKTDVREIAEVLKQTYVVSDVTNPAFNSQNDDITIDSFVDMNDDVFDGNNTSIGDTIYVKQLGVPDRWVSNIINKSSRLPAEYQEVEYIQSTGIQYINTGVYYNENLEFDITFSDFVSVNPSQLFGTNKSLFNLERRQASQLTWFSASNKMHCYNEFNTTDKYRVICNKDGMIVNNSFISGQTDSGNIAGSTDFMIFKGRNGNSSYKLYSLIIKDGGIVIRDYVPCYRESDNVPGLYDVINNVFYINNGEGNFSVGNDYISDDRLLILSKLETALTNANFNEFLTHVAGYNSGVSQTLKHSANGVIQWVND